MLLQSALSFKGRVPHAAVASWIAIEYCPSRISRHRKRCISTRGGLHRRQGIMKPTRSAADGSHSFRDSQPYNEQGASHDKHGYSNRLKQQWTVARTNLNHYPEETRRVIQQGQNAATLTNGIYTQGFSTDLLETIETCRAAIEYERRMEFVDFIGRSGECFSSWMYSHLKKFEAVLESRPQIFNIEDYKDLLAALHEDYVRLNSRKQRKDVVDACENMLLKIHKLLAVIPRHSKLPQNQIDRINGQVDEAELTKPKISTADFRSSFMQRALEAQHLQGGSQGSHVGVNNLQGDQRTELWKSLRSSRLTASAFSKALGFFPGDRVSLWEEKIGVREPFKGNDATKWGTMNESNALVTYEKLTGQKVESCMFKVKKDDVVHDWLGASPDGLVAGLGLLREPSQDQREMDIFGSDPVGPGILEIKCPFNKGRPDLAEPPKRAIWYYMPQIQGLMDVFDREWCILYVWTPQNGSSSFIISRDREYWSTCFDVLAEFWWTHTVPARQLLSLHGTKDGDMSRNEKDIWIKYKPSDYHQNSEMLKEWSKRIAWNSPGKVFPHIEIV